MDTGAWWAAVHGAAKSRTRVSDCHFHFLGWLVQSCALNSLSILHDSDMIASVMRQACLCMLASCSAIFLIEEF